MLMDEPFGAVDPIAREKLQMELLRLQGRIRKTIVMVIRSSAMDRPRHGPVTDVASPRCCSCVATGAPAR